MNSMEAFKEAVNAGDAVRVKALLETAPSLAAHLNDPLFPFDEIAIVVAAARGNRPLVDVLLDAGADVNARGKWWAGPFGVLHHSDTSLAPYLISRGATVDIHAAANLGMLDRLRQLLEADPGAVNLRGPDGMMPLHFAASAAVAELLLHHGAEIDARDVDHGGTPAQHLVRSRPEVSRYLVGRGAEVDPFLAAALGDLERLRAMLQGEPSLVHAQTCTERFMPAPAPGDHIYAYTLGKHATPLCAAARCGQVRAVELLLEYGASVNGAGNAATPLHLVASDGNLEMVRYLVGKGADTTAKDPWYNATPLGWARYARQQAVAHFLRDR